MFVAVQLIIYNVQCSLYIIQFILHTKYIAGRKLGCKEEHVVVACLVKYSRKDTSYRTTLHKIGPYSSTYTMCVQFSSTDTTRGTTQVRALTTLYIITHIEHSQLLKRIILTFNSSSIALMTMYIS